MKIEQIREMIEGTSEDARFSAWMALYAGDKPEFQEELKRILTSKDPILKILLAHFLGPVAEEKAIALILKLIQDDNPVVAEAAEKSFERNRYEDKLKHLLPLVHSKVERTQFFAIDKTALGGIIDLVKLMLNMIGEAKRPLLLQILTALRYFPSKKLISRVDFYLKDPDQEIRLKTILIFGSLYENNYLTTRKYLIQSLEDPSPQVRQTALWCLRRKPNRRDLSILFRLSVNDPDPHVRQESLLEMSFFPNPTVISHLLALITTEKDRIVTLKGEGVLLSLKETALLKGLKKALNSKNQLIKNKAMVLMAEFEHGSDVYFNFLAAGLKKTKTEKEKLPIIEALGVLENKRAIPLLEALLSGSPLVSYVTMNALMRIWKNNIQKQVLDYLQNEKLSALAKQMVLQNLLRQGAKGIPPKELTAFLIPYLKESNLNLRYLAAQIILKLNRREGFESLLEVLKSEKDPTTFKLLKENLLLLFSEQPQFLLELIIKYAEHPETINRLFSLMQEVNWFGDRLLFLITALLQKTINLMAAKEADHFVDFIAQMLCQNKITFEKLLKGMSPIPEKEKWLSQLVLRFQKQGVPVSVPVDLLAQWMGKENDRQKEVVIDLMALSRQKEAIAPLMRVITHSKTASLKSKGISAINQIIWGRGRE